MMLEHSLLFVASLLGFLISLNFVLIGKGILSGSNTFLPRICRLDDGSCKKILSVPEAQLFGVPNSWLGVFYYAILLCALLFRSLLDLGLFGLFFASLVSVGMGVYLTYVLLFRLRINCTLCFVSHLLNLIISLILLSLL